MPGVRSAGGSHAHEVDLEVAREYVRTFVNKSDDYLRELYDAVNANEGSAIVSDVLPIAASAYRGRFYYLDTPWDERYYCSAYGTDATGALEYRWARVLPPEVNKLVKDDAVGGWATDWADNFADPYVGFYRDELTHRLWLMGQAEFTGTPPIPTGAGNPIFTLPVGYRPEQEVFFACACLAVSNHEIMLVGINTSGVVYPASVPTTSVIVDLTVIHARIADMEDA
jgi:hypothetical protein